jgi:FAD/FMN-containing dehydrogenase
VNSWDKVKASPVNNDAIKKAFPDLWVEEAVYPALMPSTPEDIQRVVHWCRDNGMRLFPVGRGHTFGDKLRLPSGVLTLVSLNRDGISEPDQLDLVIEAEAGVPVSTLHEVVHDAGFRLDGWPSDYPGTVGGLLAGRRGVELRHLVLGMDIIDGRGKSLRFGGRIRKNVSGFDVSGTLVSSQGALSWIDRVYLRLTPGGSSRIDRRVTSPVTQQKLEGQLHTRVARAFDPDGVFFKLEQ